MELHILFGATARGKTEQAQALWRQYHYPIVSVDSRKVYRGADIGTNKLSLLRFMHANPSVLVGGIDFLDPTEEISAYFYQQYMFAWFAQHEAEITQAGGIILHGGTGLYLDALLQGNDFCSPRNPELRAQLNVETVQELQQKAALLAPERFEKLTESDQQNPRRLIRLLENQQSSPPPPNQSKIQQPGFLVSATRIWHDEVFVREVLYQTINTRVERYLTEGWLAEVNELLRVYGKDAPALHMMGYKQLAAFMTANQNWEQLVHKRDAVFEQVLEEIKQAHRRYAKRQITWAKKYQKAN